MTSGQVLPPRLEFCKWRSWCQGLPFGGPGELVSQVTSTTFDDVDQETDSPDILVKDGIFCESQRSSERCNDCIGVIYRSQSVQAPWQRVLSWPTHVADRLKASRDFWTLSRTRQHMCGSHLPSVRILSWRCGQYLIFRPWD